RLADHLEHLAEVVDLFGTGVEDGAQDVVLGQAVRLRDDDDALAVEQIGNRARVGQRSAVARERDTHLGRCAVAVVGEALDEYGDTAGCVALIHARLVVGAAGVEAGAASYGSVDVVVWHRTALGFRNCVGKGRIARGVTTAGTRGNLDVLDEFREELAPACVDDGLLVLRRRPLAVSTHWGRLTRRF